VTSAKQLKKAEFERKIFSAFADRLAWPHNDVIVQSRPEPEPDIEYTSTQGSIAFELVEICDSTLAHQFALIRDGGSVTSNWTSDPTPQVITRKLNKKYVCEHPIELLCYWNAMTISTDDLVSEEIHRALNAVTNHPFRRVWYFGESAIFNWANNGSKCLKFDFDSGRDPFWQDCFF